MKAFSLLLPLFVIFSCSKGSDFGTSAASDQSGNSAAAVGAVSVATMTPTPLAVSQIGTVTTPGVTGSVVVADPVGVMDATGMSCHDPDFTFCHEYFSLPPSAAPMLQKICSNDFGGIFEHRSCPRTQRSACVRADTRVNANFACFVYAPGKPSDCKYDDTEFQLVKYVEL